MNVTRIDYSVCIHGWESIYVFSRNCFPKMTLFKVMDPTGSLIHPKSGSIRQEWHEIDTLLLHTTNRKYHMAYLFVPFSMTFDDLEGRLMQDLSNAIR